MKIITQPTVQLASAPMFNPHGVYALPHHEVPAENIIAMAGKVCYDSYGVDGRSVNGHISSLMDSGHHSVIEHAHVGVFIEGISRGCSHEIVRHRMFNYSQRSTRYTAEDDAAVVLDPYYAEIRSRISAVSDGTDGVVFTAAEMALVDDFLSSCDKSIKEYQDQVSLLERLNPNSLTGRDLRKWCRGKARQLLPHALETRMVMTGNLRAWRHFFIMRTSRHAEAEIRRLASAIFDVVLPIAPMVFEDLCVNDVDGFREISEAVAV